MVRSRPYIIIILKYAFHTHRRIKSKFPNHSKSIFSGIYQLIIPPKLKALNLNNTNARMSHCSGEKSVIVKVSLACDRGVLGVANNRHVVVL